MKVKVVLTTKQLSKIVSLTPTASKAYIGLLEKHGREGKVFKIEYKSFKEMVGNDSLSIPSFYRLRTELVNAGFLLKVYKGYILESDKFEIQNSTSKDVDELF